MFKDALQRKLREMEKENPSPSLQNLKPTLKDKWGFFFRFLSMDVGHIPQYRSHIAKLRARRIVAQED